MRIVFYAVSPHGRDFIDPDYLERVGVGGSETACCLVMQELRRRGHEVLLETDPTRLRPGLCDWFIALRDFRPFALGLKPGRSNWLWCHDDMDQPFLEPMENADTAAQVYGCCDRVVMLSRYQRDRWQRHLHLPNEKIFLCGNGIDLAKFPVTPENLARRPCRAYFAGAPYKGLEPLLFLWPQVKAGVPEAELEIYSSLQMYRQENDAGFSALCEQARAMDGVRFYGSVGKAELRRAAQCCRVYAFPCVWAECHSMAVLDAMAAGTVVVGTELGGLPESAPHNPMIAEGPDWTTAWVKTVQLHLRDEAVYLALAQKNLRTAQEFSWSLVVDQWLAEWAGTR